MSDHTCDDVVRLQGSVSLRQQYDVHVTPVLHDFADLFGLQLAFSRQLASLDVFDDAVLIVDRLTACDYEHEHRVIFRVDH